MDKTTNYQLNQWDPDDKVRRTDFNADNAKIDAALKANADAISAETSARISAVQAETSARAEAVQSEASARASAVQSEASARDSAVAAVSAKVPKIAAGTYTGNGAASQNVNVGFRPKAVLIMREDGSTRYETSVAFCYGGLILSGCPIQISSNSSSTPITCAEITSSGFRVYYNEGSSTSVRAYLNTAYTFHYLAIG